MDKIVWVLILIIVLVTLDKGITIANVKAAEKNFPEIDKFSVEKNPIAKWSFNKFSLIGGTILFGLFSIITFILALILIELTLKQFGVTNAFSISLWIVIILYCMTIGNNLFFLLKFSKVVP